jgi:thiamine biosynthesis lipoprotein
MGMPISIDVRDPGVDASLLDEAFAWLRWVDETFSTYRADSDITRLNLGHVTADDAHPDVREVLQRCLEIEVQTDGYFDIRAIVRSEDDERHPSVHSPGAVDPSGFVKGWAVDRAARILLQGGARNFSVNAGGDVRVSGGALPEARWRVGVQHPLLRDKVAAVVSVTDAAIATSGTYARGEHIVDPRLGGSPQGLLSVTIVGPELGTADAYATAAFAMGTAGPQWTARLVPLGYEAMSILADQTVLSTPGFPVL